jgi:sugar lactone lactonase YvrE
MGLAGKIISIDPSYGIPGGEVVIDCADLNTSDPSTCAVWFDNTQSPIVALSSRRILAVVPETKESGAVNVVLQSGEEQSAAATFTVGKRLAADLHPVTNPAFDPDDGALFVTRSGSRGEQLPVTLFRIGVDGEVSEYSGDITNPTGIAFGNDGQMFVTSRLDGVVYRLTPFKEAVAFARNLGVATGLAFDRTGVMYVGDRSGTIYKVNGIGDEKAWAQIEPSVSAYHLAFGPDDQLYVTGPTVTSFDSIWRIDQDGNAGVFFKGLGRPQGLAFDREGNLYVSASLRGRRGIVRILPDGQQASVFVAGVNLVGLAFSATGDMAVVSIDSVYSLPTGIKGVLLPS